MRRQFAHRRRAGGQPGILTFLIAFFFGLVCGAAGVEETGGDALGAIITLGIPWLYYALMESSVKQATLGKMALGIVVTDLAGNRISFGRATGRYWAKLISALTLLAGFVMAGFTAKKQALHDMIAGCLVVTKA